MIRRLRGLAEAAEREARVWRCVLRHPRTPVVARWMVGLALAYLVFPIDLIPDMIPVVGELDDLVLVGLMLYLARRMIPPEVIAECRARVEKGETP